MLLLTGSPVVLRNNKCMQSQPAYTYYIIISTMYSYLFFIDDIERDIIYIYNDNDININIYIYITIYHLYIHNYTYIWLKFLHKTKSDSPGRMMSHAYQPCVNLEPDNKNCKWIKPHLHSNFYTWQFLKTWPRVFLCSRPYGLLTHLKHLKLQPNDRSISLSSF